MADDEKATVARGRLESAGTALYNIDETIMTLSSTSTSIRAGALGWPDAAAYKASIECALRPR